MTAPPPPPARRTAHQRSGTSPSHPASRPVLPAPGPAVHACSHGGGAAGSVSALIGRIGEIHDALAGRPDLVPAADTDALFSELVALAIAPRARATARAVLADPVVRDLLPSLRTLCARGEFELERWWSRRVLDAPCPRDELSRFPYDGNYRDLTRMEVHAVRAHSAGPPRRVLFVGSGPLPMTSLLLAREHGCEVDNLDVDDDATIRGRELAAALGVPGLRFATGEVTGHDLRGYDLVCVAALAGLEPSAKADLLGHLAGRLAPGTLVLARSAHALRALLYPVLDPDDLAGLSPLAVVHPYTDVVNSVVVARVPVDGR